LVFLRDEKHTASLTPNVALSRRSNEVIASHLRVHSFDTGFVCIFSGIAGSRRQDAGYLREYLVVKEFRAQLFNRGK
jgi:hypothetical protein